MKKILLIDAETREVEALAEQLQSEGTQVRVAPGGLFALTMLEREQPHLILSRSDLGDMSGEELCSMVKRDNLLSGTQVVLLARSLEEKVWAEQEGEFDLVLLDNRPLDTLAASLGRMLDRGLRPMESESRASEMAGTQVISGSLGVLSFAELTQAFSQTGKTGRLILDAEQGRGEVLFADGKVRHAVFGRSRGIPAFARLFYETERSSNTAFRFEPMDLNRISDMPRTIDQTAQQLLLSAAVHLDENTTTEMVVAGLGEDGTFGEGMSDREGVGAGWGDVDSQGGSSNDRDWNGGARNGGAWNDGTGGRGKDEDA